MINANINLVNLGIVPNDGSGDPIRTAMAKINNNFSNLYSNGQVTGNVTDSVVNPSFSWPNARRSGLYHSGVNSVGLAVDGQTGLVITNAGTISFNGTSLIGGGSGLSTRTTLTANTATLASGASESFNVTGYSSYLIGKLVTNSQSRVQCYISSDARTADAARAYGTSYSANAGILLDLQTPAAQTEVYTPAITGFDANTTGYIYCKVTNTSGTSKSIQIQLSVLQIES